MKQTLLTICTLLMLVSIPAQAQESGSDQADSVAVYKWKPSLIANAAASQVGFDNWAEGGVSTLGMNLGLDGKAEKSSRLWSQLYELRMAYGVVKQDTLDFRKSEDIIRIATTYQYLGQGFFSHFNPTVALSFRSQFSAGYNYKKNPFEDGRNAPVKVSDLMSPGTFQESIGLTYTPSDVFKQRMGVGSKQTVVLLDRLGVLYGVDEGKQVRFELGLESFSEFEKDIFENVHFKSSLGFFAAFNKPESPDVLWENFVAMKVNSWLSVNFEWVVLYNTDVSSQAQLKEVFAVGISYILL